MSFLEVTQGALGQVNNNLQNNLAANAAWEQGQQAQMNNNLNYVSGANQAAINSMYGPQGFGGATAQAAATGAAYGRAVGGGADIYAPSGGGGGGGSVFDTGAPAYNDYGAKGGSYGGFGGEGATPAPLMGVPQQAPNQQATIGYTPDYSATQNGFGYPGGAVSQMFDPSTYGFLGMGVPAAAPYNPPSTAGMGGGYAPFAGGPTMTFGPDGEFTGWDFSGGSKGGGGGGYSPPAAAAPQPQSSAQPAWMNAFAQAPQQQQQPMGSTFNQSQSGGGGSKGYSPFAGGPSMTFDADGNFTGWDFGGGGGTNYNTFQGGASQWANSIPGNDPNMQNAVYAGAGNTGLYPSSIAAVMNEESNWNPKSITSGNYGVPQMSADMWGDRPFNGQMAGQTFQQFQQGSGADQINAYMDWLNRSGNLTKGGIDVAAQQDPAMQAALLQAIQFGGNHMDWRTALANGNMSVPVAGYNQAQDLGRPPTVGSMYNSYSDKMNPQWTGATGIENQYQ